MVMKLLERLQKEGILVDQDHDDDALVQGQDSVQRDREVDFLRKEDQMNLIHLLF